MERIGVGLVHLPVIGSNHAVLVYIVFLQAGNKYLPNALFIHFLHGVAAGQPAVEIAHHAHCAGMRRPQPEHHTLFTSALEQVCAEELLRLEVVPLKKEIDGISFRTTFAPKAFDKCLISIIGSMLFSFLPMKVVRQAAAFAAHLRPCSECPAA